MSKQRTGMQEPFHLVLVSPVVVPRQHRPRHKPPHPRHKQQLLLVLDRLFIPRRFSHREVHDRELRLVLHQPEGGQGGGGAGGEGGDPVEDRRGGGGGDGGDQEGHVAAREDTTGVRALGGARLCAGF